MVKGRASQTLSEIDVPSHNTKEATEQSTTGSLAQHGHVLDPLGVDTSMIVYLQISRRTMDDYNTAGGRRHMHSGTLQIALKTTNLLLDLNQKASLRCPSCVWGPEASVWWHGEWTHPSSVWYLVNLV